MSRVASIAAGKAGQVQATAIPLAARGPSRAAKRKVPASALLVAGREAPRVARAAGVPGIGGVATSLALRAAKAALLEPT